MTRATAKSPSSTISTLECTYCRKTYDSHQLHTVCPSCGKVLYPRYDLESAKEFLTRKKIQLKKVFNIWRFHEIMPVNDTMYRISLGEGWTPLIPVQNFGRKYKLNNVLLKDEGQNPTGTFKSRGLCAAVAKALELGIKDFVIPTAGNAGAALAAYAARANGKSHIFAPEDTDPFILKEIKAMGGDLHLVHGLISDAGVKAKEMGEKNGWFPVSTLKEPYRVEGKKTMGFELAEHFDWHLPDVIVYPTGGGTGIVGMWKAFDELEQLGLIGSDRPRMVSVQPAGCQPMVRAFQAGDEFARPWENAFSAYGGIRVPSAIGDYLILKAVRESHGTALAVDDKSIEIAMREFAREEGIMLAGEAAATVAAVIQLKKDGWLNQNEQIILFGTGSGLTTPGLW